MEYNFKLCVICTGDSGAAENLAYSLITRGGVRVETFRLVDRETGETVYEGTVKQTDYNGELSL